MHNSLGVPSRIDSISFCFRGTKLHISVKRDDLIHPLLSGNKWRKLKYYATTALNSGKIGLISVGGAYSNHLLAVSALAAMHKLNALCVIRGDEKRERNEYEQWMLQLGADLQYVSRATYGNKQALYESLQTQYPQYLLIPEGGHPLPDHRDAASLLDEQELKPYSHLILSCGTGAMYLTLAKGLAARETKIRLHGISAIPNAKFISSLQLEGKKIYPYAEVHDKPVSSRFGRLHPDMLEIAKSCFQQCGILPDPVYDSALLLFLYESIKKQRLPNDGSVLWLHSGGQTGWSGYASELQKLCSL